MKVAGFCLGWELRQSRLSLVCSGSPVQAQARLGQVRRQGEGRDGPSPAAARALGQEGEVGYRREERGSFFVSSYTSASQLSSSTGVFVSTPPFTARRSGHRLGVNPAYSSPLLASVFSMLFKEVDCVWCVYAGPGAAHERE